MTAKTQKLLMIIASAVALAAILALVIVLAVQCSKDDPDTGDNPPAVTVAPEVGTYYFDASIQEYTLTLNEGNTFALFIKGETFFGLYTLKDGKLSLDFTVEGKATLTAELKGDVVSMTYDGASYRLLKKTTYTVSFETNGGSMIQFNVVDDKIMIDAQAHPEDHKDLMVRVAGYSAYFVNLTSDIQNELIERTSQQF